MADPTLGIALSEFLHQKQHNVVVINVNNDSYDPLTLIFEQSNKEEILKCCLENVFDEAQHDYRVSVRVGEHALNIRFQNQETKKFDIDIEVIHQDATMIDKIAEELRVIYQDQKRLCD